MILRKRDLISNLHRGFGNYLRCISTRNKRPPEWRRILRAIIKNIFSENFLLVTESYKNVPNSYFLLRQHEKKVIHHFYITLFVYRFHGYHVGTKFFTINYEIAICIS